MIEGIIGTIIASGIIGLTSFAWANPPAYRKIYPFLIAIAAVVAAIMMAWDGGLERALGTAQGLTPERSSDLRQAVTDHAWGFFYTFALPMSAMAYGLLLFLLAPLKQYLS